MIQNSSKIIEFKNTTISKEEASYFYRCYYFKILENESNIKENFLLNSDFILYDVYSFDDFYKRTNFALIGRIRIFPNTLTIENNDKIHDSKSN